MARRVTFSTFAIASYILLIGCGGQVGDCVGASCSPSSGQVNVGGAKSTGGAASEGGAATAGGYSTAGGQSNATLLGCLYNGRYYPIDASFRSGDGCNSCLCELVDGSPRVWCTEAECVLVSMGGTTSASTGGSWATGGVVWGIGGSTYLATGGAVGGSTSQSLGGSVTTFTGGALATGAASATGGAVATGGLGGTSGSACVLPPDSGSCDAAITRYYFDVLSSRCEPLTYGGCGGNGNRFDTLADCERSCPYNPRMCPPRVPPSDNAWQCVLGSVCYYRVSNSCLCTLDGFGSCTLVDPNCVSSTTPASTGTGGGSSLDMMPAVGGAGGIAAPQTLVCSCGYPAWVCGYAWGLF
jgi:hypothetical protein